MMSTKRPTEFISAANAQQNNVHETVSEISVARWFVDQSIVTYQKPDSHTLSLYLRGGENSYRADKNNQKGAPGKFCLMPQNQAFNWHINDQIDFVHLYFRDDNLRHFATTTFDLDARFVELADLVYQQDNILKRLVLDLLSVTDRTGSISPLHCEQASHTLMHYLLQNYNCFHPKKHKVNGGLAPVHRRMIKEMILHNLGQQLSIDTLSKSLGLSPFHFARMFKASFGLSPACFITRHRVELVKRKLGGECSIADLSLQSGFSHQSHMTKTFRQLTGLTPAAYRKQLAI